MKANLFPSILIAGPPHSGKSVLSFLLTWKMREMGLAHYLLRAAPDGEGDWFHLGNAGVVRTLRLHLKDQYSSEFVARIQNIIDNRLLPLLVDVGGLPSDEQFGILRACTHVVLLYRTEADRSKWKSYLSEMDLIPIAELRSDLDGEDTIMETYPTLQGTISRLDRHKWRVGSTFRALLSRVMGICHYDEFTLEQIHRARAPLPFFSETELAKKVLVFQEGKRLIWDPSHLGAILECIPPTKPLAIYGRGPTWLAAAIAAHAAPAPVAYFDARYGWVMAPGMVQATSAHVNVQTISWEDRDALCALIKLPQVEIEPEDIFFPDVSGTNGLVLSGRLPRWLCGAIARKFAPLRAWIALDDPGFDRIVVVSTNDKQIRIGTVFSRPQFLNPPGPL